jgi:cytoskeletal protein CcmA (bactofilin family)
MDKNVTLEGQTVGGEESKLVDPTEITLITKGTTIKGGIISDNSLEVMGTINGDVECQGKLTIIGTVKGNSSAAEIFVNTPRLEGGLNSQGPVKIGVGTVVVGDVKGTSAVIAGAVKGNIDVNGPVIIDSTAIVLGDVKAKSLQLNNGAVLEGSCSLGYADIDLVSFFNGDS